MPALDLGSLFLTAAWLTVGCWLPGRFMVLPFQKSKPSLGPWFLPVLETAIGYAFYTPIADFTVRLFGPTIWGFIIVPLAIAAVYCLALWLLTDDDAAPGFELLCPTGGQSAVAGLFALIVVLQVVPFHWDADVFWGTPEIDWRSRLGVVHALARDGVPAANPFFDPTGDHKLFFYYGYFLFPAGCVAVMKTDPTTTLAALVFVSAYSVALTAAALGCSTVSSAKGGWIPLLFCFVTGLDLLPVLTLWARGQEPASIEWWSPAQITAMTAFPVWTPHHTAATLFVLFAHILAWQMEGETSNRKWWMAFTLGMLLGGSGLCSTYVAMLGFLSLGLSAGWKQLSSDKRWAPSPLLAAVLIGGGICIPFYASLSQHDSHGGPAILPILRPCPGEHELHQALHQSTGCSPAVALFLVRALGLVPQYFIELGVLFLVLMFWHRTGLGKGPANGLWKSFAFMAVTALVVGSIFVSVRTWNCDLNWRIMHPLQIVLTGAAAAFWFDFRRRPRPIFETAGLAIFVLIGFAGVAYDLFRARFDYVVRDRRQAEWAGAAERIAHWANVNLPHETRILFAPPFVSNSRRNGFLGHSLRHHLILADADFNAYPYGPPKSTVDAVIADAEKIFAADTDRIERQSLVEKLKVDVIIWDEASPRLSPAEFGPQARIVTADDEDRWRIIQIHRPQRTVDPTLP